MEISETRLRPSEIRFTCNKIDPIFKDNQKCNAVILDLVRGEKTLEDFSSVKVVKSDGKYYSNDNKLLYILRAAQFVEAIDMVPIQIASEMNEESKNFSTKTQGKVVEVEDGDTIFHYKREWLKDTHYMELIFIAVLLICLTILLTALATIYTENLLEY